MTVLTVDFEMAFWVAREKTHWRIKQSGRDKGRKPNERSFRGKLNKQLLPEYGRQPKIQCLIQDGSNWLKYIGKANASIAFMASLDGKFTISSGRKTVIQVLRDDFDPLEISEQTGHATQQLSPAIQHSSYE